MNKKLFSNSVVAAASAQQAASFIGNPRRILDWDPEVALVENSSAQGAQSFQISRSGEALNKTENIAVEAVDGGSEIIYHSTGGRLEYNLIFSLEPLSEEAVRITQTLEIEKDADNHLPVTLLAPIAKHSFNVNLHNLGNLLEREESVLS